MKENSCSEKWCRGGFGDFSVVEEKRATPHYRKKRAGCTLREFIPSFAIIIILSVSQFFVVNFYSLLNT